MRVFSICAISVFLISIAGCSSPSALGTPIGGSRSGTKTNTNGDDNKGNNGDDAAPEGDDGPATDDNDDGPVPPGGSSTTPAGGTCSAETSYLACSACCDKTSPAAARAYDRLKEQWLCQTPGTCSTQCASTFCAGRDVEPKSDCATCLTANVAASEKAATPMCNGDATCAPVGKCYESSACGSKPR